MSRRERKRSRELLQQRKRDDARVVMRSLEGLEVDEATGFRPLLAREKAAAQMAGEGVDVVLKPLTPPSPQAGEGAGMSSLPTGGAGLSSEAHAFAARYLFASKESHSNEVAASSGPDQTAHQSVIPPSRPGPRTAAGKAVARGNAVKHGLSGAGKVLPEDMRVEVERLEAAFREDFPPTTATEVQAVFNMALGAVRMERCLHLETVLTERNRVRDLVKFDRDRQLVAEQLGQELLESPAETVLKLRGSGAGYTWLITRWQRLLNGLENGICRWQEAEIDRACALLGTPRAEWHLDTGTVLLRQAYELARSADREQAARGVVALQQRVAQEITYLEQDQNDILTSDLFERTMLEQDLRFDTSPEVEKVRRLGADASRLFHRSFRFLMPRYRGRKESSAATREPYPCSPGNPYTSLNDIWENVWALLAQTEAESAAPAQNECAPAQNECAEAQNEWDEARDGSDPAVSTSLPMPSATFSYREGPHRAIAAQASPVPEPLAPALAS